MTDRQASSKGNGGSSRLLPLAQTQQSLTSPEQDIRGRRVLDSRGEELGRVDELIVDEGEERVRFIRVAHGGLLGIGGESLLLPVETITRVDDEQVHVNQDRDKVAGGPRYNPDLQEATNYEDLYGYYGLGPFWATGYVYPPFPYYT